MAKTATIRARIEPELKSEVENIFKKLGVSTTEVISMLYSQVRLNKGLPFEVKIQSKPQAKMQAKPQAKRPQTLQKRKSRQGLR